MNAAMSIAVVDDGGHLKAFVRMDGASFGSAEIAVNKAYSAVAFGFSTEEFFDMIKGDLSLLHGLPSHGRMALYAGGIPLKVEGVVVGGIGVSGGRPVDDVEVANAGVEAVT